ncbi:unnamed protein product [Gadus morhua 'NCC']
MADAEGEERGEESFGKRTMGPMTSEQYAIPANEFLLIALTSPFLTPGHLSAVAIGFTMADSKNDSEAITTASTQRATGRRLKSFNSSSTASTPIALHQVCPVMSAWLLVNAKRRGQLHL